MNLACLPRFNITKAGHYPGTLTVWDPAGNSAIDRMRVNVTALDGGDGGGTGQTAKSLLDVLAEKPAQQAEAAI